jgi:hypothetical protein
VFGVEGSRRAGQFGGAMSEADALLAWAEITPRHDELLAAALVGALVSFVLSSILRRHWLARRHGANEIDPALVETFNAPARWLAIRADSADPVREALGLEYARPCVWSAALHTPFEPRLFIAPPVNGWVLVMGCDVPDPQADVDEFFLFLSRLSARLGTVRFFQRNPRVEHHGWAALKDGQVERAYVWCGAVLWNQGGMTREEQRLGMVCLPYGAALDDLDAAGVEVLGENTDRVLRLADRWSLNPLTVRAGALAGTGIAGVLRSYKIH